jgi:hypothetical protein
MLYLPNLKAFEQLERRACSHYIDSGNMHDFAKSLQTTIDPAQATNESSSQYTFRDCHMKYKYTEI